MFAEPFCEIALARAPTPPWAIRNVLVHIESYFRLAFSMMTSERAPRNDGRSMRHTVTLAAILCCTATQHIQIPSEKASSLHPGCGLTYFRFSGESLGAGFF